MPGHGKEDGATSVISFDLNEAKQSAATRKRERDEAEETRLDTELQEAYGDMLFAFDTRANDVVADQGKQALIDQLRLFVTLLQSGALGSLLQAYASNGQQGATRTAAQLSVSPREIEELQSELSTAHASVLELESQVSDLGDQKSRLARQADGHSNEVAQLQQAHDTAIRDKNARIADVENQLRTVKAELNSLRQQRVATAPRDPDQGLRDQVAALTTENDELRTNHTGLQADLNGVREQLGEHQSAMDELEPILAQVLGNEAKHPEDGMPLTEWWNRQHDIQDDSSGDDATVDSPAPADDDTKVAPSPQDPPASDPETDSPTDKPTRKPTFSERRAAAKAARRPGRTNTNGGTH